MEAHAKRRSKAANALTEAGLGDALLIVGAGEPIPVPGGLDRLHPFETHPDYFWLTGGEAAGGVAAFDPADGPDGWSWFEPPVSEDERLWEGVTGERSGTPIGELAGWLAARRGRPIASAGCALPGLSADPSLSIRMAEVLLHARRAKDAAELEAIRRACEITAAGHRAAQALIEGGGVSERAIADEIDTVFRSLGSDGPGYDIIVGAGPNAAVLHFPPGDRVATPEDTVLIDAGARAGRYTADVTRVYPSGPLTAGARDLIRLVQDVEAAAVEACRPGVEFSDLHDRMVIKLLEGLSGMGLLSDDADDLLTRGVGRLFMPHGLGHLVGLGVRDATGAMPGRDHRVSRSGVRVRLDAVLDEDWVVTVEPGCYFIPRLLDLARASGDFENTIRWAAVESLAKDIQGVRIEDDVHVTANGPSNLTSTIQKVS